MKAFFLPLLALAVLFAGLYVSSDASAASPYDAPQYTEELSWSSIEGTCDLSNTWFTQMEDTYNGDKILWDFTDPADYYWGVVKLDNTAASFRFIAVKKTIMTIGGGTYGYYTNSTNKTYGIPFSYEAMFDANYSTNYAYVDATVDVELCEVSSSTDFSSPFVSDFYGGGASNSWALVTYDIFSPSGINASIFFINAPFIEPEDFEGEPPREGVNPPEEPEKEIRRPNFTYQQSDKAIKATPYSPDPSLPDFTSELDEGYTFQGYYLGWNVWKCPGDWDTVTGLCSETLELIDDQFTPVDGNYEFTVSDYGNYQLEVEYWAQQCFRYPSYPATPDHCFYSQLRAHFEPADFDYVNSFKNLTIDGRSITGDTRGEQCNVGGYCQPATAICHTVESFIERLNCEMSGQLSMGLLNPSLQAVKTLVASVVVPASPSCTVPLPNPVIAGHTLNLSTMGSNLCSGSQTIRTTFPVIPVILNAAFAMAILAYIIFRLNRLLDNNKHDVLEKI